MPRSSGAFIFNVWDRIEDNEFADVVTAALASYHDRSAIERDVRGGGFTAPVHIDTVTAKSSAPSPRDVAIAYCQGTPLRSEIEARGPGGLGAATDCAAAALAQRFGAVAIAGRIQAHVVTVER